jgi:hypothetical protein
MQKFFSSARIFSVLPWVKNFALFPNQYHQCLSVVRLCLSAPRLRGAILDRRSPGLPASAPVLAQSAFIRGKVLLFHVIPEMELPRYPQENRFLTGFWFVLCSFAVDTFAAYEYEIPPSTPCFVPCSPS